MIHIYNFICKLFQYIETLISKYKYHSIFQFLKEYLASYNCGSLQNDLWGLK